MGSTESVRPGIPPEHRITRSPLLRSLASVCSKRVDKTSGITQSLAGCEYDHARAQSRSGPIVREPMGPEMRPWAFPDGRSCRGCPQRRLTTHSPGYKIRDFAVLSDSFFDNLVVVDGILTFSGLIRLSDSVREQFRALLGYIAQ